MWNKLIKCVIRKGFFSKTKDFVCKQKSVKIVIKLYMKIRSIDLKKNGT